MLTDSSSSLYLDVLTADQRAGNERDPLQAGQLSIIERLKDTLMSITAINVRNQFRGKIREIIEGPVVSEVDVETAAGIVTSVITTRSIKELGLVPGKEVLALVKATDVSIATL